jgi:hypothetical protein
MTPFEWTRGETIALADQRCCRCWGIGLRPGRAGKDRPCGCVLRAIFRICLRKFQAETAKEAPLCRLSLGKNSQRKGSLRPGMYHMRSQEYRADFVLAAKRTLGEDAHLYRVFTWHFLLGADYRLVNRKLGRPVDDRGLFHEFYKIEELLGRVFRELQPYSLWPTDEYFLGTTRSTREGVSPAPHMGSRVEGKPDEHLAVALRFPIKKATHEAA